jgi:hypothetical protein
VAVKQEDEPILEAEVVEIDGVEVESRPADAKSADKPQRAWRADWRGWQGKVRVLDKRWAPLWILLGIIAFILLITIGTVVAVFTLAIWIVKSVLRAVMSMFDEPVHTIKKR